MPLPAGAGVDRRRFLLDAAGGLLSVYAAGRIGLGGQALQEGIAQAAAADAPDSRVLVSIFLAGGIDALSILGPTEDPLYRKLRPTLAIGPGHGIAFGEDPRLSWAPAAASFARLHATGRLSVLPGIGYSSPDMSHFTSRHYWEVGATDARLRTGWLGRFLDVAGSAANPLQGLSMDGELNPVLATTRHPVAAIDRPESFRLWIGGVSGDLLSHTIETAATLGSSEGVQNDPAIAQVAQAASEVGVVHRAMAPFATSTGARTYSSPVPYPRATGSDFPQRLAALAAMLAAGLPLRCVALTPEAPFDTHASQAPVFGAQLAPIADAIAAFQADLEARGLAGRVLVHVWSEFGRRAQENGSQGTDHGAAGLSMLVGSRVTGTMIGEWPALSRLDADGNQRQNVDFRGVYCSLLEQWFDHDAEQIIPHASRFARQRLVR